MAHESDEDKSLSLEKIYSKPLKEFGMTKPDARRRQSMPNAEPGEQHKCFGQASPELVKRRKKRKFVTSPNDEQAADVLNRNKPKRKRMIARERSAQTLVPDPIPPPDNPDDDCNEIPPPDNPEDCCCIVGVLLNCK